MTRLGIRIDKSTEKAVHEILKSRAESRIYLYLLRKNGAKSDDIIKGTKLHPSTVRELLSKMHNQKLISREKLKNDSIGKNPFFYRPVSPLILLQKKAREIEERLNKLANITDKKGKKNNYVKIKIYKRDENA
jgi:sugar-specific transcriptional regulator TrmB